MRLGVVIVAIWWGNKWSSIRRSILSIIQLFIISLIIIVLFKLSLTILRIPFLWILRIRTHTHTHLRSAWTLIPHITIPTHTLFRWTDIHFDRIVILLHSERGRISLLIRCPWRWFILLICLFWVPFLIKFSAVLYIVLMKWTEWLVCLHYVFIGKFIKIS